MRNPGWRALRHHRSASSSGGQGKNQISIDLELTGIWYLAFQVLFGNGSK